MQSLRRVDHQQADVGTVDRPARAQRRVELDPVVDLRLPPEAGRVHEDEGTTVEVVRRVDRVARRTGGIRDDQPFLAEEPVDERRLADVRATHDRDPQRLGNAVTVGVGEALDDQVEEVPGVLAVRRRHRDRIPCPEVVELVEVGALRIVDLVRDEEPGLPGVPQQLHEACVTRMEPGLRIHHQQHQVSLGDRLLHLALDRQVHREVRVLDDPAGVDEPEVATIPLGEREVAVTGRARFLAHDRVIIADDAVEERRLPDVGTSDQRDHRDVSHRHRSRRAPQRFLRVQARL